MPASVPTSPRCTPSLPPVTTMLLVRHAKAARPPGVADIDRPLAPRGESDARLLGAFLAVALPDPGRVITSPARRARRTADLVAAAAGWTAGVVEDDCLYGEGVGALLQVLSEAGGGPVAVFGHEPVWSHAVAVLTGGGRVDMVTGGAAALEGSPEPGGASLLWMVTPAALGGGRR